MKTKFKKTIARLGIFLLAVLLLINIAVLPARADTVGVSDISSIFGTGIASLAVQAMKAIFGELGVNEQSVQYSVQTANVAENKQQPPQVSLSFNPVDPIPNQEVTATATPSYFMNDTSNLYFTWYIQHHNGDGIKSRYDQTLGKTIKCDGEGNCDLNGDGKIDIEDYKIAAMRMIASNNFDWVSALKNGAYSNSTNHAGYKASFGGNDQAGKPAYCYIYDPNTGYDFQLSGSNNGCSKHLFPNTNGHGTVGDGSFGTTEEKFWHTDPNSDDTAYTGNVDGANVAGLGINSFTWVYEPGDRVGVAVEGVSIEPTQKSNSSYKTMWAYPKGKCDVKGLGSNPQPDQRIGMTVDDINNCLTDNLVDPAQGGGEAQRLNVSLSFSPQNPMNDENMQDGDQVTVSSTISNLDNTNPNYLNYQWQVYGSNDPNPDSWGEPIDLSNNPTQAPDATPADGLGLSSFSFNLDFQKQPAEFMLVKLTVTQNISGSSDNSSSSQNERKGIASVVIPITSSQDQIGVYPTTVTDDDSTKPPQITLNTSDPMCTDATDRAVCPVAQDSIIGLSVTDPNLSSFLWTVNGNPVTPVNGSNTQTNVAYFPVLNDNGSQYTINLIATDLASGQKVNLTRVFQVVDPTVTIATADQNTVQPILLGYYVDLNGKQWPDYSSQNFQGLTGTNIKLQANFSGYAPPAGAYTWFVNNEPAGSSSDTTGASVDQNGILSLTTDTNTGDAYSVGVGYTYAPTILTQKALNYYWNVPVSQMYSVSVGSTAQITLVNALPSSTLSRASIPPKKILASLYSSLPSYLAFLFRVVLTIFIILFTSGLVLSFSAQPEKD